MSEGWLIAAFMLGLVAVWGTVSALSGGKEFAALGAGIVAALCAGFIAWWIVTDPSSGTVTKRHYSPAHTSILCTGSGKSFHCSSSYTPECYSVTYHDPTAPHEGSTCVSPEEYRTRYPIGSHYPEGVAR